MDDDSSSVKTATAIPIPKPIAIVDSMKDIVVFAEEATRTL
jgi:hypothetical protein